MILDAQALDRFRRLAEQVMVADIALGGGWVTVEDLAEPGDTELHRVLNRWLAAVSPRQILALLDAAEAAAGPTASTVVVQEAVVEAHQRGQQGQPGAAAAPAVRPVPRPPSRRPVPATVAPSAPAAAEAPAPAAVPAGGPASCGRCLCGCVREDHRTRFATVGGMSTVVRAGCKRCGCDAYEPAEGGEYLARRPDDGGGRGSGATEGEVRAWALRQQLSCPSRGRIPRRVRQAYDAAHPTDSQEGRP
jgi:hypothetical protein